MTSDITHDVRQLVGPLDPAGPSRVPDQVVAVSAVPASEVFARATSERPAVRTPDRRHRRRWALVAGIALVASGSFAAAKLLDATPASNPGLVRCYSVATLTDNPRQFTDTAMAAVDGQPAPDIAARVNDAVSACAGLWQIGLIQNGQIVPDAAGGNGHAVPPLVACVLPNGVAAVFPGDGQTCRTLGLAPLADRH
jgi:hypothetical protein